MLFIFLISVEPKSKMSDTWCMKHATQPISNSASDKVPTPTAEELAIQAADAMEKAVQARRALQDAEQKLLEAIKNLDGGFYEMKADWVDAHKRLKTAIEAADKAWSDTEELRA